MIKQILISAILIQLTLTAGTSLDIINGMKGQELFQQLSDVSPIGKDLISAIQLELTTGQNADVAQIVDMLQDVKVSITDQQGRMQESFNERDTECMSATVELQTDLAQLRDQIAEKTDLAPARQTDFESLQEQINTVQEENEFYQQEQNNLEIQNAERRRAFEEARDAHDDMAAALESAKSIIEQLRNGGSFLQKKSDILLQISSHANAQSKMKKDHNRKLFSFLMQLATDAGRQADQSGVESILSIINELLQAEEQTRNLEYRSETRSQNLMNDQTSRIEVSLGNNNARLLSLQGDLFTADVRLRELNNQLNDLTETQTAKRLQLADHRAYCTSSNADLAGRLENYDEILRVLNQVVLLLEHSSIQGVRNMVQMNSVVESQVDMEINDPDYNPLDN